MKLTIAVTVAFSLLGSSVAYPGLRPLNVDKAIRPTGNSVASTPGSVNEMKPKKAEGYNGNNNEVYNVIKGGSNNGQPIRPAAGNTGGYKGGHQQSQPTYYGSGGERGHYWD